MIEWAVTGLAASGLLAAALGGALDRGSILLGTAALLLRMGKLISHREMTGGWQLAASALRRSRWIATAWGVFGLLLAGTGGAGVSFLFCLFLFLGFGAAALLAAQVRRGLPSGAAGKPIRGLTLRLLLLAAAIALAGPGDTIWVKAGRYEEPVSPGDSEARRLRLFTVLIPYEGRCLCGHARRVPWRGCPGRP